MVTIEPSKPFRNGPPSQTVLVKAPSIYLAKRAAVRSVARGAFINRTFSMWKFTAIRDLDDIGDGERT